MIRQMLLLLTVAASGTGLSAQSGPKATTTASPVRFIDDIEIGLSPENSVTRNAKTPAANTASASPASAATARYTPVTSGHRTPTVSIEDAGTLHLKFAVLLNVEVEQVPQLPLLILMDDWWGTRYRLGGHDRSGIDCSGFTSMLFSNLFQLQIPRTAREQYQAARSVDVADMREGDLVFFTVGGSITHVGFYLQNNKFVHASTSEGVTISDLNDRYWQARFAGAGRIQ
ncbi:C40 family peptidase [Flaviaesturariibacter terrae]